jgi:O-antigen ligase
MKNITTAALFFLAAGIFTSVTILSAYQILFAIPCAYYTYLAIKHKEVNLPKSAWFLLAFAVVAAISIAVNFEHIPKPSKNIGRIKYFLFGLSGIFVFRVWLKEASEKTKKNLVSLFLVTLILAGIASLYNFFFSDTGRVRGLTGIMRYGYGSAMILLALLSAILHKKKTEKFLDRRIAIAAFILGLTGMYLSYTRGALLGFLCGLPFVLYYYRAKLGLYLGGIAVISVIGLGGMYLFGTGQYESRFLVNKNNPSDVIRRSQWKAAIIATQEKPVLGWGFSNYHSQLKRIKHQYDLDAKHFDDSHSHNLFLEVASGTGLIGFFIFIGWVLSWAYESFKARGLTRAMLIPFGVAFVVSSQFEVTFDANNASMIFCLYALSTIKGNHV